MTETILLPVPLTPGRVSDLLSRAGAAPQRGEALAVLARLAREGRAAPSAAQAVAALEAIRATPGDPDAVSRLAEAAGYSLESMEREALAMDPPETPAGLRAALLGLRRAGWPRRLGQLANAVPGLPWRRVDQEQAAAAIDDPAAADSVLIAALESVVAERLRAAGDPDAALAQGLADIASRLGKEPALDEIAGCATRVATAFGLPASYAAEVTATERARRREARAAERAAREARAEEEARQREWERSLVAAEAVPALLGCTEAEAARWIREGLIPTARRVTQRRGPKTIRRSEFDPAAITALRPELTAWRAAEAVPERTPRGRGGRGDKTPAAKAPARGTAAQNAAVARVAALDRYAAHFTTARAMDRRITLVTGPTNSGKTYYALEKLAAAESGLALAPLRLLAHEFREALLNQGVPVSLTTGEERDMMAGARHVAATVEMCPFQSPVDVAVIDEAQMLDDPDRGAAWTAAIMGVPAREVIVLGAPDCAAMVRRVAELCGDPVTEVTLERKSPLAAAMQPVKGSDLGRGDALIAFSRREVLAFRAALMKRGKRVACVYGALSPEVRRAEARRFREGEVDILVATDAIGMGLNFGPLRRVVFSALSKWDGREQRALSVQDIKQIGGRAGRFGHQDEGLVGVLAGAGDPAVIARALVATPAPPTDTRPRVAPDADIVAAVAAEIGTDSLYGTLIRIGSAVLRADDPNYRLGDLGPQIAIAGAIDRLDLPLLVRWTYAMCPVNIRDRGVERLARWALDHAAGRQVPPPTAGRLPPPDRTGHEEQERAEKIYRRLVAWRWLSMRFPDAYADQETALAEGDRLNGWIEAVLATRPSTRDREV